MGRGCGFGLGLFVGELDYVVALILVVRLSWYLMVGSRFLTCMFSWVCRLCYDLVWVAFACLVVVLVICVILVGSTNVFFGWVDGVVALVVCGDCC